MTRCPRCGEGVAAGQEYCLECGLRLPGASASARPDEPPQGGAPPSRCRCRRRRRRGGCDRADAGHGDRHADRDRDGRQRGRAATTAGSETALAEWPTGTSGWTNILVSIPKIDGRDAAVARAEQARRRGLRRVGVIDSSRYASLHPGYWVVFAGVYPSEPEATSRLREARGGATGRTHGASAAEPVASEAISRPSL